MDARIRDRLAIALAVAAVVLATGAVALGRFDSGVRLALDNGRVIVWDVAPLSPAYAYGLRAGMIATSLDGVTLVRLPQLVYPDIQPTPDPNTGEFPPILPTGVDPPVPIDVPIAHDTLVALIAQKPVMSLDAIQPWDLEQGSAAAGWNITSIFDDGGQALRDSAPAIVVGSILMLLVGWWLASGRAGPGLQPLAVPLAVATGIPFVIRPLEATWSPFAATVSGVVIVLAMLPLAIGLIARIEDGADRRLVGVATAALTTGALALAVVGAFTDFDPQFARWVLIGAIPIIPGLAAAGPVRLGGGRGEAPSSGRLLESAEFAVAGVTPLVALNTNAHPENFLFPLSVFWLLVFIAGRYTIRPLARLASRAALQRDLVVAATEAERARVAADIHDDALQELTILVHRLDAAGDAEGAGIARTVSDRLRAICGDLRLPILDDLGVGPALDWLVLRIERLAGGEVRLERTDGTRPPANVELAFFRVAQEALSNAVKHGRPPIVVRYTTSTGGASLSIDDAGTGIAPDAGESAEKTGHFGLLNMQQRAEAIGAILDVRRWPAGGTHVKLDWRAH